MHVSVCLHVCMPVQYVHAGYHQRPEEGMASPGTGVIEGYELPRDCWEPNPDTLQEQSALLTSLQPQFLNFLNNMYVCTWGRGGDVHASVSAVPTWSRRGHQTPWS